MKLPTNETMVRHILAVWDSASASDIKRYANWYGDMNRVCQSLADMADLPLENVAAAMAWLSPQQTVLQNVAMTAELCEAYADRRNVWQVPMSQYPAMVDNAIASLLDGPTAMLWHNAEGKTLPNRKVRSFFRNIMGIDSFVTVDRHAVAIAVGNSNKARNGRYVTLGQPKGRAYERVADAYRVAARRRGVSAPTMQAVTWCVRRGSAD